MSLFPQPLTSTAELRELAISLRILSGHAEGALPQIRKQAVAGVPAVLSAAGAPPANVEAATADIEFQLKRLAVAMDAVGKACDGIVVAVDEAVQIRVTAERGGYAVLNGKL